MFSTGHPHHGNPINGQSSAGSAGGGGHIGNNVSSLGRIPHHTLDLSTTPAAAWTPSGHPTAFIHSDPLLKLHYPDYPFIMSTLPDPIMSTHQPNLHHHHSHHHQQQGQPHHGHQHNQLQQHHQQQHHHHHQHHQQQQQPQQQPQQQLLQPQQVTNQATNTASSVNNVSTNSTVGSLINNANNVESTINNNKTNNSTSNNNNNSGQNSNNCPVSSSSGTNNSSAITTTNSTSNVTSLTSTNAPSITPGTITSATTTAATIPAIITTTATTTTTTSSSNNTTTTTSQKDTTFTKIFVGGLPYHTTDKSLRKFFESFGDIEEAVVITDRQTGKSRGYGFVTMADRDDAERAVKDANPIIDGRKANVNLAYLGAKPRNNSQNGLPYSLRAGYPAVIPSNQFGLPAHHYVFHPNPATGSPYIHGAPGLILPNPATSMTPTQFFEYSPSGYPGPPLPQAYANAFDTGIFGPFHAPGLGTIGLGANSLNSANTQTNGPTAFSPFPPGLNPTLHTGGTSNSGPGYISAQNASLSYLSSGPDSRM